MRSTDFPFVPAWCEMLREMERLGLELDPLSRRYPPTSRYFYPFDNASWPKRELDNIFRHEIQNFPDEIILVIEMHDCRRESIQVHLIGSDAVEISCTRERSHETEFDGHNVRGSWSDTFLHTFPLPEEVTMTGASSTIRNGVLEIRLKKKRMGPRRVPIR